MRAARFHEFGGPEVLQIDEVDWPHPTGDEVLIRVHGSSVNGTDLGLRRGEGPFVLTTRRPFIPGFDVAGEVVRLGPKVTAFEVGDKVYSLLGHGGGGAAEYVAVRQARVALAPTNIPLAQAAAVPLAGLTALQGLRGAGGGKLRQGARVLVYGASGGIGAFAVQLAKHFGAFVAGAARADKLDFVRDLGADELIDSKSDLAGSGETWDIVFDTPSALKFSRVRPVLGEDGVLISTRGLPADFEAARALFVRSGPRLVGVMTKERGSDLAFLARLIDEGALRVPVDKIYPLEDIAEAHRYAEGREVRGKVVVTA